MISFHIHGQEFDLAFPPCPLARWPLIRRDHFVSRATCASICQPMKRPESPPPRRGTTRSPAGSTYASLGVSHAGVVHSLTVLPTNALLSCATNTCSGVRPECHVFFRMQVVVSPPVAQRRSDRLLCMVPYTLNHIRTKIIIIRTLPACLGSTAATICRTFGRIPPTLVAPFTLAQWGPGECHRRGLL